MTKRRNSSLKLPLYVRIFHGLNLVFVLFLLLSGFQIFNVHPRLYFGNTGDSHMVPAIALMNNGDLAHYKVCFKFFAYHSDVTGWWGQPVTTGFFGVVPRFYPSWMTLPTHIGDMGVARGIHFLFIFAFTLNFVIFMALSIRYGHLQKDILPIYGRGFFRKIGRELGDHLVLRNYGEGIKDTYNLLQKLVYTSVLVILCPLLIVTGAVMSPTMLAACPWLGDFLGGRQTARTIHFICANTFVLFIIIHVSQAMIVGLKASLRVLIWGTLSRSQKGTNNG